MPAQRRVVNRLLTAAWVIALIVYAASSRYALIISLGQRFAIGIQAGALLLQDRTPAASSRVPRILGLNGSTAAVSPLYGPDTFHHAPVHAFRHDFSFVWRSDSRRSVGGHAIELPLWYFLAAFAALTLTILIIRRFRAPPGHCRFCRYDLRACTGTLCPECGAAISVAFVGDSRHVTSAPH